MQIDPNTLSPGDAYQLMTACVIPRPVAWTSTQNAEGTHNLAPFSFFGGVTSSPFTVMMSVGRRRGERKDTARNLLETREAVVHISHQPLKEAMVATSAEEPAGVSEFQLADLTPVPSSVVAPPRIAEAAIALEARLAHHMEVGTAPVDMFLLEVQRVHVADHVLVDGLPDPAALAAIGRLGGPSYCDTAQPFEIQRP